MIRKAKYLVIYEDDFKNEESKKSLKIYNKTRYLMMIFETFFKRYSLINFGFLCRAIMNKYLNLFLILIIIFLNLFLN